MPQIFIVHSETDSACAAQIGGDLATRGYAVWQMPAGVTPEMASYPRALEQGIGGSTALVVVWSTAAAQDEWVERQVLFAQRLQKPLVAVLTDDTALPITLVTVPSVVSAPPCADAVAGIAPHLPPPDDDDLLLALLTHSFINERKRGIAESQERLRRGERREEILAQLEYIARNDLMPGVQAAAQAVLDEEQPREPQAVGAASRHVIGVQCHKCGHVTYFDKRQVCAADGTVKRLVVRRAGQDLDELTLTCSTCGAEMVVPVDCAGYK